MISLSRGAGGEAPAPQLHHPLLPRPRGGLPWESQRDPVGHPLSALGRPVPSRASLLPKHLRVQVSAGRTDVNLIRSLTGGQGTKDAGRLRLRCTEERLCGTDTRGMLNPGAVPSSVTMPTAVRSISPVCFRGRLRGERWCSGGETGSSQSRPRRLNNYTDARRRFWSCYRTT